MIEIEAAQLEELYPNVTSPRCLDNLKEQEKYVDDSPFGTDSRQIRKYFKHTRLRSFECVTLKNDIFLAKSWQRPFVNWLKCPIL